MRHRRVHLAPPLAQVRAQLGVARLVRVRVRGRDSVRVRVRVRIRVRVRVRLASLSVWQRTPSLQSSSRGSTKAWIKLVILKLGWPSLTSRPLG